MRQLLVWLDTIMKKHRALKRWQRIVTVLAAILTFATTYALILPAITVEKDRVEDVGGMYLEREEPEDMLVENAPDPPEGEILAGSTDEEENAPAVNTVNEYGGDSDANLFNETAPDVPEEADLMTNGEEFSLKAAGDQESTYVFNWRPPMGSPTSIILHYQDGNGNPLDVESGSETIQNGQRIYLTDPAYAKQIEGYNLYSIMVNGEEVNNFTTFEDPDYYDTKVYFSRLYYGWNDYVTDVETYGNPPVDVYMTYLREGELDPNLHGGGHIPLPAPSAELPEPKASKTLTENLKDIDDPDSGDGTYTLTLSMEVPKIQASTSAHKNVVVVFDTSNSMSEPVNNGDDYSEDQEYGAFYRVGDNYYKVGYNSIIKKYYYIDEYGKQNNINGTPTFYSPKTTRLSIAREKVKELAASLLALNENDQDAVELSFVQFDSTVENQPEITTDYGTFAGWVDTAWPSAQKEHNFAAYMGATNWDAALRAANAVSFNDQDQTYIIFISDGNPTARTTEEGDDGDRIGSSFYGNHFYENVYGTGRSDTKKYNFRCAENIASKAISEDDKIIFNVGLFGDAGEMAALSNHGYYDAADAGAIENAFTDIIGKMSVEMGYTNLSILDGLTNMTSSIAVKGNPDDFIYKVTRKDESTGRIIDVTKEVLGDDFPKATYTASTDDPDEQGVVTWNLGDDRILLEGGTYSVSFIVWPNQEAYDLVADLNNGKDYDELSEDEKSQIVGSGPNGTEAPFSLRTNTRQSVKYSEGRIDTDAHGNQTITPGAQEEADLETPNPLPLTDSKVKVQKKWDVSLDSSELADFLAAHQNYKVKLRLMKDTGEGEPIEYISGITIDPVSGQYIWPEMKNGVPAWHNISTGLMVSREAGLISGLLTDSDGDGEPDETAFDTYEYDGTTYYMLETGRDYYFEEDYDGSEGPDYHFEFEKTVFHPMLMDNQLRNVKIEDGKVIVLDDEFTTLTAVNNLKGGINLKKFLVDETGAEITNDKTCPFTMHGSVTRDGEGIRLEYRLIGDEYTDENGDSGRTEKRYIEDSTDFTLDVHAGDWIRFVNVPSGYTYRFSESDTGSEIYVFESITGQATRKNEQGADVPVDPSVSGISVADGELTGTTIPNAAQDIIVKNRRQETPIPVDPDAMVSIDLHKKIDYLGDGADNADTTADNAQTSDENRNAKNDLYRLYLDTVLKKSVSNANIILVEDYSTSMNANYIGNKTRYETMRSVLTGNDGFVKTALATDSGNQMTIIKFSDNREHDLKDGTRDQGTEVLLEWTGSADTALGAVDRPFPNAYTSDDGYPYRFWNAGEKDNSYWTDYSLALQYVEQQLDKIPAERRENPTYVIFLSDGLPTVYMDENVEKGGYEAMSNPQSHNLQQGAVDGKEVIENLNVVIPQTNSAVNSFMADHKDIYINTIGFAAELDRPITPGKAYADSTEQFNYSNYTYDRILRNLGRNGYEAARTGDDLLNSLKNALKTANVSNVAIHDELSDYVDLYTNQPDFAVTKKSNGKETKLLVTYNGDAHCYTVTDNGTKVGDIIVDGKKVTLDFVDDLSYENDDTYTLSFNVEASTRAYEAYALNKATAGNNGYGEMEGSENTDYGTNDTSSGKPGFHSNKDAYVHYEYQGETHEPRYDHPVIQVGETKLEIEKIWDPTTVPEDIAQVQFDLKQDGRSWKTVTLKRSEGWHTTVEHLAPKRLVETDEGSPVYDTDGVQQKKTLYVPIVYTLEEISGSGAGSLGGYTATYAFTATESSDKKSFTNITSRYEGGSLVYYIPAGEGMARSDRGKVTVTNKAGQITIEKQWKDSEGRDTTDHPENITYTVYQVKHVHEWGEWETVDAPTEEREGSAQRVCKLDSSHVDTRTLAKKTHEHLWKVVVHEPTCTVQGFTEHICQTDSSHNYNDSEVQALGHDWGDWVTDKPATKDEEGTKHRVCQRPGCGAIDPGTIPIIQNFYPGTTAKVTDYKWPVKPEDVTNENMNDTITIPAGSIFMYGDQYAIVYENISALVSQLAAGPTSNGAMNNATFIGEHVYTEESFALDPKYDSNSRQNGNLQKGDLFQATDGSYWVFKGQSNGKRPAEDENSWYQIPNTVNNAPQNGLTGVGKMMRKFSLLRGAAATELTTTAATEAKISELRGKKGDNGKPYYVVTVYATGQLDTPTTETGGSVTLPAPIKDEDGNEYSYYVVETAPGSGYSTSIGGMQEGGLHDGDTVVITNTENPTDKAVTLRKVGESNADSSHTQSNLGGAVFTVYADKNGKPGEVVTVDNKRLTGLTSAADTGVIWTGNLPNGTYWIHEDSAPKGYHTLTGDIKLVVGETLSVSPAFVTSDPESVCSVQDDGITIKIVNVRGASLPSTGGAGTGAFTVLGSVLALGAGWLLFRRRMQIM